METRPGWLWMTLTPLFSGLSARRFKTMEVLDAMRPVKLGMLRRPDS